MAVAGSKGKAPPDREVAPSFREPDAYGVAMPPWATHSSDVLVTVMP